MRSVFAAALFLACASNQQPASPPTDAGEPEPDAVMPAPDTALAPDKAPLAPDGAALAPDGAAVAPDADRDTAADAARAADAASSADVLEPALRLTSTGFLMKGGDLIFPASASYPMDHSPPFAWSGAPPETKSFALTFVDESNGATKWVVWDIPATVTMLPGDLSKAVNPPEVPGSSQRGSLGRTGYSGPGVPGPPLHVYQFVLWALDVQKLPDTTGLTTADLRTKLLPMHAIAKSPALVAKGQEGGP
ncbi:MAG TPA: YbhB/YbcL family Raf kinase inhibitor-like protein [Polyangia bacterium]|nr:YbhB/YbcL family Raf kinase inhibitor-like protein [Polyangia bacterium]